MTPFQFHIKIRKKRGYMIWIATTFFLVAGLIILSIFLIKITPEWVIMQGIAFTRWKAGLKQKTIIFDNYSVYSYLDGGSGETILMLHGFGADKDIFLPFASELKRNYRIVIPDLFEFGESTLPQATIPDLLNESERLLILLDTLHIDRAHLVGNSMGGQLALFFAAHYPERVQSLCLISPSGLWHGPQSALMQQIRHTGENPLIVRSVEDFKRSMEIGMLQPPKLPSNFLKVLAKPRIDGAESEEGLFNMLLEQPADALLEKIQMPTLIIFGMQDRIIEPVTADYMKSKLYNAEIFVVSDASHVAMYERPKDTAHRYEVFLEKLG